MSFLPYAVKSIQRGVITVGDVGAGLQTADLAVTAIDTNFSICRIIGQFHDPSGTGNFSTSIFLVNSTTVRATRMGTGSGQNVHVQVEVIEFYPIFIKSIQAISDTILNGVGTKDVAITAVVVAKSMVILNGIHDITNPPNIVGETSYAWCYANLTSTTNFRLSLAAVPDDNIFKGFVVEFR